MVFELLPKTCNFTICSIFSNSGHVGWCTASSDTILKLNTLVMIQTKFGFHWSCTFRGEDFWKSLRRTTDDDDGRQVMAIAHLTLWVRWAKNRILETIKYVYLDAVVSLRVETWSLVVYGVCTTWILLRRTTVAREDTATVEIYLHLLSICWFACFLKYTNIKYISVLHALFCHIYFTS